MDGLVNYWPRWIRAIRGKTLSLSMAQMGAYDRLLDYYYEEEKPLPHDIDECCRIAGAASKQDRADVQKVLAKFFLLADAGYVQERAESEIVIGLKKIAAAQSNGAFGGRPKGSKKKPSGLPGGLPAGTQDEPTSKAPHHHTSLPSVKKVGTQSVPPCPNGVAEQVWNDWLALRKSKRAPVTQTVIEGALVEASKAQMTLEAFLRIWCSRGSQGLEADWLKPHERQQAATETAYARSMREKYENVTPMVAAAKPGAIRNLNPMEVLDGLTRISG